MSPQEINKAIAESLGWTHIRLGQVLTWVDTNGRYIPILQFTSSLDACRLFEDTFDTIEVIHRYSDDLMSTIACDIAWKYGKVEARYKTATATPAQRCEAYLRMKGFWKEDGK